MTTNQENKFRGHWRRTQVRFNDGSFRGATQDLLDGGMIWMDVVISNLNPEQAARKCAQQGLRLPWMHLDARQISDGEFPQAIARGLFGVLRLDPRNYYWAGDQGPWTYYIYEMIPHSTDGNLQSARGHGLCVLKP